MALIKGRMQPAYDIVSKLGGVSRTAEICQCDAGSVSRWMTEKERGGRDGTIPQKHWRAIILYSREHGLGITLDDLFGV